MRAERLESKRVAYRVLTNAIQHLLEDVRPLDKHDFDAIELLLNLRTSVALDNTIGCTGIPYQSSLLDDRDNPINIGTL